MRVQCEDLEVNVPTSASSAWMPRAYTASLLVTPGQDPGVILSIDEISIDEISSPCAPLLYWLSIFVLHLAPNLLEDDIRSITCPFALLPEQVHKLEDHTLDNRS